MVRRIEMAGSVASIAGLLLSFFILPGFKDWVYPLPLVVGLGVALTACIGTRLRARLQPAPADQERLDQLFAALPREAIWRIQHEDFGIAWPDDLMFPVYKFYNELGDVEHQFDSKTLEKHRKRLRETADCLSETEAMAIGTRHGDRRYLGITSGELDTASDDDKQRFEERRRTVHQAAIDFVEAHNALVKEAKRRKFSLRELESNVPNPSWAGLPPIDIDSSAHSRSPEA